MAEGQDDLGLDIGNDSVVQGVEEEGREQRDHDQRPLSRRCQWVDTRLEDGTELTLMPWTLRGDEGFSVVSEGGSDDGVGVSSFTFADIVPRIYLEDGSWTVCSQPPVDRPVRALCMPRTMLWAPFLVKRSLVIHNVISVLSNLVFQGFSLFCWV